jgi:hypothetical protein
MKLLSINNKFIVEPYVSDRAIKTTTGGGFALIQQKVAVKGLRLLVDAKLAGFNTSLSVGDISKTDPEIVLAGSIIYIREEFLHSQPWAKQLMECDAIEGKFIIVDRQYVEFVHYA